MILGTVVTLSPALFSDLLSTRFLPHSYCYLGNGPLTWLHVVSDTLIGLAYVAIAATLAYLVHRARRNIPFHWMFLAFGAFIVACGATHFMEVLTIWHPLYWFSGAVKVVTALASVTTAIALIALVPRALGMIEDAKMSEQARELLQRELASKQRSIAALAQEISERKRGMESALMAFEESEAKLRSLAENSPYGICRTSVGGGQFVSVNPALVGMLGYGSEKEVLALNLSSDVYRNPGARARLVEELRRQERFHNVEIEWKRKDGSPLTVSVSGNTMSSNNGAQYFEVIVEDVTTRRELEAQLRQAQKMEAVGRLAGGVAHDFNNMLMIISGYAELVLNEECIRDCAQGQGVRGQVEKIREAAKKASQVSRQLLAFSRKQVLEPRVLELNKLLTDVAKMLLRLLGEDVELVIHVDPKLGRIRADSGQLEQVILNLAVNARDAMPKGGRLVLETANADLDVTYAQPHAPLVAGSYVMLAVSDNGSGMDHETQAHIFEPFFTTKEKGKGTGLGLATVYGIVKQSGGYIWVYSEPGAGTTFKVYLPRVDEAPTAPRPQPRLEEAVPATESILLVEDEEDLRHVIRGFLEKLGYQVLEAKDATEALKISAEHPSPIHLMVTDMIMPGMRGRELAGRFASSRPQMKVLYISGYTDGSIVQHGELQAGSAFLGKPFGSEALARKVRELLDGADSGGRKPQERPRPEQWRP